MSDTTVSDTTVGEALEEAGLAPTADAALDPAAGIAALAPPEPVIDEHGRTYATGKRKDAIARVWLKPGKGELTVNGRSGEQYFARPVLRMQLGQPLVTSNLLVIWVV